MFEKELYWQAHSSGQIGERGTELLISPDQKAQKFTQSWAWMKELSNMAHLINQEFGENWLCTLFAQTCAAEINILRPIIEK